MCSPLKYEPRLTNLQFHALLKMLNAFGVCQWCPTKRPLKESLITVIAAYVIRKSIRFFHLDNCSQTKHAGTMGQGAQRVLVHVIKTPLKATFLNLSLPAMGRAHSGNFHLSTKQPAGLKFGVKCQCRCVDGMLPL